MRCECCNKILSDKEATARFFDEDKEAAPRYVGMCTECQGFLPAEVKILTRSDFNEDSYESESDSYTYKQFDYDDGDYGYEE